MDIDQLGIDPRIAALLKERAISKLYPVQELAIKEGLLNGRDLLVTSPTASGKTLLAILAMSKKVIERPGKMIYLTPLRSLAYEKYIEFKAFEGINCADGRPLRVAISTGDYDEQPDKLAQYDVLFLTYEKFDSIWRKGPAWLRDVTLYVIDELHMLADNKRGPVLEAILARIKLERTEEAQLLALSATIGNADALAAWLDVGLVTSDWRPVPLREGIYLSEMREIRFRDGGVRHVRYSGKGEVADVALDTIAEGGQALVFTETRRRAVALAKRSQDVIKAILDPENKDKLEMLSHELLNSEDSTELTRLLSEVIKHGVAFHHAGLSAGSRRLVEEAFRSGMLPLLFSTTTLAAGVNLPARRVIIASTYRYDEIEGSVPITVMEYRQMGGRAGRPQYDDIGEIVLLASSEREGQELWQTYLNGSLEPISSQANEERYFRTMALATITARPGVTLSQLGRFFSNMLIAREQGDKYVMSLVTKGLEFLRSENLIRSIKGRYLATELGYRISTLYIDPLTGITFRDFIKLCEQKQPTELDVLYAIISSEDFEPRLPLRARDLELAEAFIERHRDAFTIMSLPNHDYAAYERFLWPFRSLMALYSWIEEKTEDDILRTFGVEPGDLRRMIETAEWLTYSMGELAGLLGNMELRRLCSRLRERIRYGIKEELLDLISLEGVGRVRARILFNAGFRRRQDLRRATVERLSSLPTIGEVIAKKIKAQLAVEHEHGNTSD
jgi:helicase